MTPEAERKLRARIGATERRYGLVTGDYEVLYRFQRGKCWICRRATGASKALAVDHMHSLGFTRGAVRGLLCSPCNRMLGHLRDDPEAFRRAADYLVNPPAKMILRENYSVD